MENVVVHIISHIATGIVSGICLLKATVMQLVELFDNLFDLLKMTLSSKVST